MEQENVEALYDNMHKRLCSFICSRTGFAVDAEDILQDVFLRIHTHLDTIRDMDKLESWIYQVTRNSITDYYRRQRHSVELNDDLPQEIEVDESPDPDMVSYIRELVNSLPEPYRQAIILTDYEGLSQQQMADKLGISLPGAKSRVQRARQKIKNMMLQCCHYEFDMRGGILDYREKCCCCEENDSCH